MKELGEIAIERPAPSQMGAWTGLSAGTLAWIDLKRVIEARSAGVIYSERGISRLLGELGFAHISARPQHPRQDKRIIEALEKNFTDTLQVHIADLPAGTPVEIWFQDEARLGQKNGLTRLLYVGKKGHAPPPALPIFSDLSPNACSVRRHLSGSRQGGKALMLPWSGGRASHADASRRDQPPLICPKGPCGCGVLWIVAPDGTPTGQTQSPEDVLTIMPRLQLHRPPTIRQLNPALPKDIWSMSTCAPIGW